MQKKIGMRQIRLVLLFIFCISFCFHVKGQTDSIFWFAAPDVSNTAYANTNDRPIQIRIATFSKAATIKLSQPANSGFTPITASVSANSVYTINLTSYISSIENAPGDKVLNYGLYLESSTPVTVYYEVASSCDCNSELFNMKGRNALGRDFFIPSQNTYNNALRAAFTAVPPYSSFNIVATQDSTKVTINPKQDIVGHTAGTAFTITLNKGQSYAAIAKSQYASGHLQGSRVTSNRPIAITISDDLLEINPSADLAGDQIVPVDILGTAYVVVKGAATTEYTYVTATKNNTKIYYDGTYVTTLNQGATYSKQLTGNATYITSTNPVYVLHLSGVGQELSEVLVPPANCQGSRNVNFVRSSSEPFTLLIFTPSGNESYFKLNGSTSSISSSSFSSVPGTGGAWVYAALSSVSTSTVPVGYNSLSNSKGLFHIGTINGQNTYAAEYGFFDNYSNLYLGSNIQDCSLDSVLLDAGADKDSYLWSDSSTNRFLEVRKSGRYSVITKANGCTLYDTISVQIGVTKVDLGNDTTICNGGVLTLNTGVNTDSAKYLWQDSSTASTLKVSKAGKYYVKVTTPCGVQSDTIIVSVEYPPTVTLGKDTVICNKDSFVLVPRVSDTSALYTWQDGSHGKSLEVKDSGLYSVTVKKRCGSSSDTIYVKKSFSPKVNLGNDTFLCESATFVLTPKVNDTTAQFTWQDGSHGRKLNIKGAGKYFLTLKNICGISSDTITVTHSDIPTVDLGKDTFLCSSDSFVLMPVVNDTSSFYTWEDGSHTKAHTIKKGGTYTLLLKNRCGTASDTVYIAQHVYPIVDLGSDRSICEGDTAVLKAVVNDTLAKLLWQDGSTGAIKKIATSGRYFVRMTNTCGMASDKVNVIVTPKPKITFLGTTQYLCTGDSITLTPLVSDTSAKFEWYDGSSKHSHIVKKGGLYSLKIQNSCGMDSSAVRVVQTGVPVLGMKDTVICTGSSFSVSFNNNIASYKWSTGDSLSSVTIKKNGRYWVEASNFCGTASDTFNVTFEPLADFRLPNDTTLCKDDTLLLNVYRPGATYQWQDGSTDSAYTVHEAGIYFVTLTKGYCTASDTIVINHFVKPTVSLGDDTSLCGNDSLTYTIADFGAGTKISWQDKSSARTYSITQPGKYYVTLSNSCGMASDTVLVSGCDCRFFVPTAFTPNNDTLNHLFMPQGCAELSSYDLMIFNRWGEMLFETHDLKTGWDGKFHNEVCPMGVYIYAIRYKDIYSQETKLKGVFMILE